MKITFRNIADGVEFKLAPAGATIPVSDWAQAASPEERAGIATLLGLLDVGRASPNEEAVLVPHREIAALNDLEAKSVSMPVTVPFFLDVQHDGTLDQNRFRYRYRWLDQGLPRMVEPRKGAFLSVGGNQYRISEPLFSMLEMMDAYNAAPEEDREERLRIWGKVRGEFFERGKDMVGVDSYLRNTRIATAAAFTLRFREHEGKFDFDPVLVGRSRPTTEPDPWDDHAQAVFDLLPPAYQDNFSKYFRRFTDGRSSYPLGDGWFASIDEPLRRVLSEVRKAQTRDEPSRRSFAANPQAWLKKELGDDFTEEEIDALFVETDGYSDRILGEGVWQQKVIPWVKRQPDPWLPPEKLGVLVGNVRVEIDPSDVEDICRQINETILRGEKSITYKGCVLPANAEALDAIKSLPGLKEPFEEKPKRKKKTATRRVLLIADNLESITYTADPRPHRVESNEFPALLRSKLKPHQVDGIRWLQKHWRMGSPGALLADDMGLGKTLQCLAFLSWLREEMETGNYKKSPFLIVAPVGLLENWEAEHNKHLASPGVGRLLRLYGSGLRALRTLDAPPELQSGLPSLRSENILEYDWVLTTYETLRDYQHSLARIPFAVLIFDEAQKTKTPGTLVTEAAKAMRADFMLTVTGTPIENRLADMWCIIDTAQPGVLGDLKQFSASYERDKDEERPVKLAQLKKRLTVPSSQEDLPALMLRRMKLDHLEGLPEKRELLLKRVMSDVQATQYKAVVSGARAGEGKGMMLKILQSMRDVSLHPFLFENQTDEEYIRQSARLSVTVKVLDDVQAKGEKALVFLESRQMQETIGILIQRRYGLSERPLVINGAVSGPVRQKRVDLFQDRPGFDVMLLSPRAGGVGITLTAANHVVHLSRWWNPAVEDQCSDRVYRIGQNKPVTIYCPVAFHPEYPENSYDILLHELLSRKRQLSHDLLLPPAASEQDISDLYTQSILGDSREQVKERITLAEIDSMEAVAFEQWVLERLRSSGYRVYSTPRSHDGGADGIAECTDGSGKLIIQCKHTQGSSTCSDEAVHDLLRARRSYSMSDATLVAVTNAKSFGLEAERLAQANNVMLVSRGNLLSWPSILT